MGRLLTNLEKHLNAPSFKTLPLACFLSIFFPLFVPCWVLFFPNNMIKGITLKETAKNVCQGFINTSFPSSFPFLSFFFFSHLLSFLFLFFSIFFFFSFFLFSSLSTCAF